MFLPKACLFDLDGLLLDNELLHGQAWSKTAEKFGKKLTEKQLLALRGRRRVDCAIQIKEWLSKPIDFKDLLAVHKPISKLRLSQSHAMPGAEKLVKYCFKKKVPMALVTSSSQEAVSNKTSPHPWLEILNTRVLGDDSALSEGKPSPGPYLLAAKKLNVNPHECWAMEDSSAGTTSALKAGCKVWVLCRQDFKNHVKYNSSTDNPIHINHLDQVYNELINTFESKE